jgi:hypothetical protein
MGFLRALFGDDEPRTAAEGMATPLKRWQEAEIRDHDTSGCCGTSFVHGTWGGLVCTKCGR